MADSYAKIVPLYRRLDQHLTEDERINQLRYPPTGNPEAWVQDGPDGPASRSRNWDGKAVRDHQHVADLPGDKCRGCGFPWWPGVEEAG